MGVLDPGFKAVSRDNKGVTRIHFKDPQGQMQSFEIDSESLADPQAAAAFVLEKILSSPSALSTIAPENTFRQDDKQSTSVNQQRKDIANDLNAIAREFEGDFKEISLTLHEYAGYIASNKLSEFEFVNGNLRNNLPFAYNREIAAKTGLQSAEIERYKGLVGAIQKIGQRIGVMTNQLPPDQKKQTSSFLLKQ